MSSFSFLMSSRQGVSRHRLNQKRSLTPASRFSVLLGIFYPTTDSRFWIARGKYMPNVQDAHLTETQAMKISGHKTNSIFLRYNIVSFKGILESGEKMDVWMDRRREAFTAVVVPNVQSAPSNVATAL
jgi:hypothetical protein